MGMENVVFVPKSKKYALQLKIFRALPPRLMKFCLQT